MTNGLDGSKLMQRQLTPYLKKEVSKKRIKAEKTLFDRLKDFKNKLMLNYYPKRRTVGLVFPDGIFSRDFEQGEDAVQYFAELSNICKEISSIRQELKLLYLQEDIAKE